MDSDISGYYPFATDISFGFMVNATGGKVSRLNDVDHEFKTSEELGSNYYTLTYQPQEGDLNGKFRSIRVSLRDPSLHVVTKAGYYAPDKTALLDARWRSLNDLSEAAHSTIPFTSLDMTVEEIVRHPDTNTIGFTVVLKSRDVKWKTRDDGTGTAHLYLASKLETKTRLSFNNLLNEHSITGDTIARTALTQNRQNSGATYVNPFGTLGQMPVAAGDNISILPGRGVMLSATFDL